MALIAELTSLALDQSGETIAIIIPITPPEGIEVRDFI